jgi:hypothetical protein
VQNRLFQIAASARAFLDPIWPGWHQARGLEAPAIPSTHTCGRSSLFLIQVLREEGFPSAWVNGIPRLGEGQPELGPYGFFSGVRWEGHTWVEYGNWIIDITADQFGGAPVIVSSINDPRYGKYTQDTAAAQAISARCKDVESVWPIWLASDQRKFLRESA